jgi:6-phosphogluconolactonase
MQLGLGPAKKLAESAWIQSRMLPVPVVAVTALETVTHGVAGSSPVVPASMFRFRQDPHWIRMMRSLQQLACAWVALLVIPLMTTFLQGGEKSSPREYLVYVGTYTGAESKGIYAYRFNTATGETTPLGLAAESRSPSFLAVHPNGRFLYAVSETGDFDEGKSGAVGAYAIDRATGKLTLLNQVSSRGGGPCYVSVDKTGRNALTANYGGGSVAVLPIEKDGRLREASAFVQHTGSSVVRERQERPHAHSIDLSPDNRFALVADLGLDQVLVYRFDADKGSLAANDPAFARLHPGAGPRHLAFHPAGRFAYVINELASTVSVFAYAAESGTLKELQTVSTLPEGFAGRNSTAEIQVHPSGKFLYGSNRGHDSIAVFGIDSRKGTLKLIENTPTQGKTPRYFGLDPSGDYLFAANQNSGTVVIFRVDTPSGRLTATGQVLNVASPVCVRFVALD